MAVRRRKPSDTSTQKALDEGIRLHQAGDLAGARAAYRKVLAADPSHPDALHLSGVADHQDGRHAEAIPSIRRALEAQPDNPAFHSNLALALRATGQLTEAAGHLRQALRLDPAYQAARKNLAVVLQQMGVTDEALTHLAWLTEHHPDDSGPWKTLGLLRLRQRDLPAAADAFRRALALTPDDPETLNNLGVVLRDQGRPTDAETHLRLAVELNARAADARNNLGLLYGDQGRRAEAEQLFREALAIDPQSVLALNNLGVLLKHSGRPDEALGYLRRAHALAPADLATLTNLGDVLILVGRPVEALALLEEAVRLDPNCAEAHNNLAVALEALGRSPEGVPHLERALAINPRYLPALNNLGNARVLAGRVAEGTELFQQALAIQPNDVPALYALATSTRHKFTDEEVRRLNDLLARPNLPPDSRELLHFALAAILDRRKLPAEAFRHALEANRSHKASNRRRGLDFDPAAHLRLVDDLIHTFSREAFARLPSSGEASAEPIFVFGMPRSGTTLVEQILASHPRVFGAGELNDIAQLAADLPGILHSPDPYPRCLDQLNSVKAGELARQYLDRVRGLSGGAPHFVDKMTINFLHLGLIALLFPTARLVHCRRDPRDTCLSCFFHNFASPGMHFTFDLHDLGFYYRQYERLMAHWTEALPLPVFHVPYEELVKDQERWTRDLIAFCGLEWDDRCLSFHDTERRVKTASALQVRQPIYTSSVNRWKPYEQQLAPLLAAMQSDVPLAPAAALPDEPRPAASGQFLVADEDRATRNLIEQGIQFHQAGQPDRAIECYQQALKLRPEQPDALHLCGLAEHQRGRSAEGLAWVDRAIARNGNDPVYHANRGIILRALGRPEEAMAALERSVELDPAYTVGLRNLGVLLRDLGRLDEAEARLRRLVEIQPAAPGGWRLLGDVLQGHGRRDEAIQAYRQALVVNPADAEAHNNLGVVLKDSGRAPEAETCYREAVRLRPTAAEFHNNLGIVLADEGRPAEAAACFEEALRLRPAYPDARHNLGGALADLGRNAEAVEHFRAALAAKGDVAEYHNSLGASLQVLGEPRQALECYEQALALDPAHAWAHFNRSQALLLLGEYEQAWPEWEWRWKRSGASPRTFDRPAWDGSPAPGQTLLLYPEQGLGDTLQFVRYCQELKEMVGRVVLECQPALVPILRRCPGIDELVARGQPLPPFDVHAALLSVPGLLGETDPTGSADEPYLTPDPALAAAWAARLTGKPGLRVGIAWQGNPKYKRDAFRSVPLAAFAPLAEVPEVTLIALQKGSGRGQLTDPDQRPAFPVVDLGDQVDEAAGAFMDTAAIMASLDLVITSDTAIPHLAGALGVPVWLAVSHAPDWRWGLEGDRSRWYPTMRLYRQSAAGDWAGVFRRMRDDLAARVGPRPAAPTRTPTPPVNQPPAIPAGTIAIPISPGELLDKLVICRIKADRMTDPERVRNVRVELAVLEDARAKAIPETPGLAELVDRLMSVNERLWETEDALRECERARDFGPGFIALARSVYRTNDERARLKREINVRLGSGLLEEKSYAAYDAPTRPRPQTPGERP